MSIFIPTLQLVIANLYNKFEVSIFPGCGDIFDEKSGEKEKRTNIEKNKIGEGPFSIPQYNLSL